MLAALTSTFNRIALFGQDGIAVDAERTLYASFLEEAAVILKRPRLAELAPEFHQSAQAWRQLAYMMLPNSVPPLREIRDLLLEQHRAFIEQGEQSLDRRRAIRARLSALQEEMTDNFPLNETEVRDLRAELAKQVLTIHDIEQNAIALLRYAMK
jgi:hypothetical protein